MVRRFHRTGQILESANHVKGRVRPCFYPPELGSFVFRGRFGTCTRPYNILYLLRNGPHGIRAAGLLTCDSPGDVSTLRLSMSQLFPVDLFAS